MTENLTKQVVLITGAGSGIGTAIAEKLASLGAFVVVADLDVERAAAVVATIQNRGQEALAVHLDVASETSVNQAIQHVEATMGPIQILINNAGIGMAGTVLTTTPDEWDRMMSINVKGIYHLCRAVVPGMIARKTGVIVNMSSVAAVVGLKERAAYSASKGAVLALTRALQADLLPYNIRVNAVLPGTIASPWIERITADRPDPAKAREQMAARQPIGRMGSPEEIANVVAFLATDSGSFVWGAQWVADGGLTAF